MAGGRSSRRRPGRRTGRTKGGARREEREGSGCVGAMFVPACTYNMHQQATKGWDGRKESYNSTGKSTSKNSGCSSNSSSSSSSNSINQSI